MRRALFCLFFLGLHTTWSITVGDGILIPYVGCAIVAILSIPFVLGELRYLWGSRALWLTLYLVISMAVTLVAAQPEYWARSARGILQLGYSIALATILYALIQKIPREKMGRTCLVLLTCLAVASALEVLGPLKGISDTFRQHACQWVYSFDDRDIAELGGIRAKIFSPEPSVAALSLFCLSMVFVWSSAIKLIPMLVWMAALGLAIWAIRSPILVLALGVGLGTTAIFKLRQQGLNARNLRLLMLAAALGVVLVLGLAKFFDTRLNLLRAGDDGSFKMRVTGPCIYVAQFLPRHPWWGVGVVGDLQMLTDELTATYLAIGVTWLPLLGPEAVAKSISNCFALHFIYFGGLGGVFSLFSLFKVTRLRSWLLWFILIFIVSIIWLLLGGYDAALVWGFSAALLSAATKRDAAEFMDARRRTVARRSEGKMLVMQAAASVAK